MSFIIIHIWHIWAPVVLCHSNVLIIIRPHRSTTSVDVCLSVFHISEPCKKAELTEMLFGLRTRVGPRNHVLDGVQIPLWGGAILSGEGAAHCKIYGHSVVCKNDWTNVDAVWVDDLGAPKEPCDRWGFRAPHATGNYKGGKGRFIVKYSNSLPWALQKNCWTNRDAIWNFDLGRPVEPRIRWGSRLPHAKVQFLWERTCPGMPDVSLQRAVQKWLNRSRCRLGCGFAWLHASMEPCIRWGPDRPMPRGNFWGKDMPRHAQRHSAMSCAKMGKPIEMPFWLWTQMGPRKHILGGVHTVATWQIPLNHPCVAAMRSFCQITLTTCYTTCCWRHLEIRQIWELMQHWKKWRHFWNCATKMLQRHSSGSIVYLRVTLFERINILLLNKFSLIFVS